MGEKLAIPKETLEKQVQDGLNFETMAKINGCSVSSIHRQLKRFGISYTDNRKKMDIEEVRKMVESGATNDDIAEKFGVHPTTARDFIKRSGLHKVRQRKREEQIEKAKEVGGVICKPKICNKTAQKCLYGGKCGNSDCCDKLLLTKKMRNRDPKNPNICYDFVAATPKEKEQYRLQKIGRNVDVIIYGKGC